MACMNVYLCNFLSYNVCKYLNTRIKYIFLKIWYEREFKNIMHMIN